MMMNISYGKQIGLNEIIGKTIDLFVFACNHEQRVYTALNKILNDNEVINLTALLYENDPNIELKYSSHKLILDSNEKIYKLLDDVLLLSIKDEINIVVDYSCMTKSWYYSIILYLAKKNILKNKINAYFIYTPSRYSEPLEPKPNLDIAPLPGKYVVPTDKPKALIVCLGYEQNKAEGIIDHLDPKRSYIFYTDPALEPEFVNTLKNNNKNILAEKSEFVITYPFDDLLNLEQKLTNIYLMLKDDYSIIIAPLGPKPFTLIAMLISVKYHDIDIWRVGSGSDINIYDRAPIDTDTFLINLVVFEAT